MQLGCLKHAYAHAVSVCNWSTDDKLVDEFFVIIYSASHTVQYTDTRGLAV
jgi:hypothetical protein